VEAYQHRLDGVRGAVHYNGKYRRAFGDPSIKGWKTWDHRTTAGGTTDWCRAHLCPGGKESGSYAVPLW